MEALVLLLALNASMMTIVYASKTPYILSYGCYVIHVFKDELNDR